MTDIYFEIDTFLNLDRRHFLVQKMYPILFIIFAYTNSEFLSSRLLLVGEPKKEADEDFWSNRYDFPDYNYEWIDLDERPKDNEGCLILPQECLTLIKKVVSTDSYERNLQLLINSGQLLYHSHRMFLDIMGSGTYNQTGYVDIYNTMLVSALEPLSNIATDSPKHCSECGNLVYSINKKIKDFTSKYLPSHLANDICNHSYKNRSKFLHEGYAMTPEYYTGSCFPQIDNHTGNSMVAAGSYVEYNLREYINYIYRNFVRDLLKDNII